MYLICLCDGIARETGVSVETITLCCLAITETTIGAFSIFTQRDISRVCCRSTRNGARGIEVLFVCKLGLHTTVTFHIGHELQERLQARIACVGELDFKLHGVFLGKIASRDRYARPGFFGSTTLLNSCALVRREISRCDFHLGDDKVGQRLQSSLYTRGCLSCVS